MKKTSIIILNYNGKKLLEKCIESIIDNTLEDYEIIVVDNNSNDGSAKMVRKKFPTVKLIQNSENYGFSKGNNIGMKSAKSDFVLLLNNDTEVTKGWLKEMVKTISKKGVGVVGPRLVLPNGEVQKNCYDYRFGYTIKFAPSGMISHNDERFHQLVKEREVDCVSGACLLIKKSVIEKIGFLDEGYSPIYFEDVDYCFRAKRAGYKVICNPHSVLYHHKGITMNKQDWQYETYHRNRIKFINKNFPFHWRIVRIFMELGNVIKAIKERRLMRLLNIYEDTRFRLW
jgi:GT2 family glycosyltransferase